MNFGTANCGARNTKKLERVNQRALQFVYKDKKSSYDRSLNWIGLHSILERRRIQDMLITINSCFQEKAPTPIVNLLKVKDTKYNLNTERSYMTGLRCSNGIEICITTATN